MDSSVKYAARLAGETPQMIVSVSLSEDGHDSATNADRVGPFRVTTIDIGDCTKHRGIGDDHDATNGDEDPRRVPRGAIVEDPA